jgi:hypothetical protein
MREKTSKPVWFGDESEQDRSPSPLVSQETIIATRIRTSIIALAALATTALSMSALTAATPASAEPTGSVCSDCPAYKGEHSIENKTLSAITYEFRWGDNEPWRTVVLSSGASKTHTYPIGTNPKAEVPTPSVRFHNTALAGSKHWTKQTMSFHAVMVEPGYGGTLSKRKPERYVFTFNGDFQEIKLAKK